MSSCVVQTIFGWILLWALAIQMSSAVKPGHYNVATTPVEISDLNAQGFDADQAIWTFNTTDNFRIKFEFGEGFSVLGENNFLEIGDGYGSTPTYTTRLAKFSGSTQPDDVISVSKGAWLRLLRQDSFTNASAVRFTLTVTSIIPEVIELGDGAESKIKHVQSQPFLTYYGNNAYTLWNIRAPEGSTINIEILMLELHEGSEDYLYIGNGASVFDLSKAEWEKYRGNFQRFGDQREFRQTGREATVIFTSDGVGADYGFMLELSFDPPQPTPPFADSWKRITIESVLCAVYIGWVIFLWRVHVRFRRAQKAESQITSTHEVEDETDISDKARKIESPNDAPTGQSSGPIYVYASHDSTSSGEKHETDEKTKKEEVRVIDEEGYLVPMRKKSYLQGTSKSVSFSKKDVNPDVADMTESVKYEQIPYDIQQQALQASHYIDMPGGLNSPDPLDEGRSHGLEAKSSDPLNNTILQSEYQEYQSIGDADPSGGLGRSATVGATRQQYPDGRALARHTSDARALARHTSDVGSYGTDTSAIPSREAQKAGFVGPSSKDAVRESSDDKVLIHTYHDPKAC